MLKNVQTLLKSYLNCQVSQELKKELKHKIAQHQIKEKILLFEC